MPFWRTFYHLVWATKNREPLITDDIEPRLYAYIVHKAAEAGVYVYAINGWTDHLHLVVAVPPHISISQLVKNLKGASSHDLNQQKLNGRFAWQRGYGVLSLGQRQKADAEAYVKRQEEHHSSNTVIPWLERCSEIDEGPDDQSVLPEFPTVPALRETSPSYKTISEPAKDRRDELFTV